MKCPKCQYISFDSGERCRNCGYEFSLAPDIPADDLPIQTGNEAIGPLADLSLNDAPSPTPNLPLFTGGADPDAPLVTPSATPRAPLAVRRAAPAAPRAKARRDHTRAEAEPAPRLALDTADLPVVVPRDAPRGTPVPARDAARVEPPASDAASRAAPTSARAIGALVDLAIVGGIDLAVLYFTLKICDLPFAGISRLPLAPLLSFLALLNGGYAAAFVAAGGQTIGKMAAGTRVVSAAALDGRSARVPFGYAVVRAAGYVVSALPAGLGFVPAFVGRDRRALHDRLADTRVVKA
jgi:uncharacterized RDD family membrane protein YckC